MSRILDAIAKAEELRAPKAGNVSDRTGAIGQIERSAGRDDWQGTADVSFLLGSDANPGHLAKRKRLLRFYAVGLVLALAVGMMLDRYLVGTFLPAGNRQAQVQLAATPSRLNTASAPPASQKIRLPNFIPIAAEDIRYPSSHPGWQRYQTDAMEFRVFRERGSVKAIQIMARRREPISVAALDSFLGELASNAPYRRLSLEKKDGYLIEKGGLGRTAKVIIYRKAAADEIRALVAVYP